MSCVLVVDTEHRPLNPMHPGAARRLLTQGNAAVWRRYPFTIILKRAVAEAVAEPLRLTIAPGSTTTGLALVSDATGQVVWAAEVPHRGQQIHAALVAPSAWRCGRRPRHTRSRPARVDTRRRHVGWLPPSLASRRSTVLTCVSRLRRRAPVAAVSQESVRFETQLLEHPAISGGEYQPGELAGYAVREDRLEQWGRQCGYCHTAGVPLAIEHLVPKSRGGSDRVRTLTLACRTCNQAKDTRAAAEGAFPAVAAQGTQPLQDVAAGNASRWALYRRLLLTGLPVAVGTRGRTTWNRTRRGLPTTHWVDAACVGASTPEPLCTTTMYPLAIAARGRESRQMCRMDRCGFPRTSAQRTRRVLGVQTGDLVRAVVTHGSKGGTYLGRVAVRATGSFNISTAHGTVQGIPATFCRVVHRADGYRYQTGEEALPPQA